MGDMSEEGHRKVGQIVPSTADILIAVGKDAFYILDEADNNGFNKENLYYFSNKESLMASLPSIIKKEDVILVKASRGMKLECIVDFILELNE